MWLSLVAAQSAGQVGRGDALRAQPTRIGPRRDELGTFAALISRFGPTLTPGYERALRILGDGPMIDLVHDGGAG